MLEAQGLALSLGGSEVLRGASLSVSTAEVVSVMGPSGAGKSSLLFCLAGLIRPDRGQVLFRGGRIDDLGEKQRSELRLTEFGFVFQFGDLVPELTLIENVELPLRFSGVGKREARERANTALAQLQVGKLANRRAFQVSGGEMQRAAIARALVHDPAVIFADEPTGALDESTGRMVLKLLLEAAADRGAAVVLVTHDPEVAEQAHRQVRVRDGRIRAAEIEDAAGGTP